MRRIAEWLATHLLSFPYKHRDSPFQLAPILSLTQSGTVLAFPCLNFSSCFLNKCKYSLLIYFFIFCRFSTTDLPCYIGSHPQMAPPLAPLNFSSRMHNGKYSILISLIQIKIHNFSQPFFHINQIASLCFRPKETTWTLSLTWPYL